MSTLPEFLHDRIAEREVVYRLHDGVQLYLDGFTEQGYTGVQVGHKRVILPNDEVRERHMTAVPADDATLRECAALRAIVGRAVWSASSRCALDAGNPCPPMRRRWT